MVIIMKICGYVPAQKFSVLYFLQYYITNIIMNNSDETFASLSKAR